MKREYFPPTAQPFQFIGLGALHGAVGRLRRSAGLKMPHYLDLKLSRCRR